MLIQSLHDGGEMQRQTAAIFRNEDHHLMTELNKRHEAIRAVGQIAVVRLGITGCPD